MAFKNFRFGKQAADGQKQSGDAGRNGNDAEWKDVDDELAASGAEEAAQWEGDDAGIDATRRELNRIDAALRELEPAAEAEEDAPTVRLSLHRVLQLLPEKYVTDSAASVADGPVAVRVSNLLEQLQKGKVVAAVTKLVLNVPAECVTSEAHQDWQTEIALPLAEVVGGLDPAVLAAHANKKPSPSLADRLPNPFADPLADTGPAGEVRLQLPSTEPKAPPVTPTLVAGPAEPAPPEVAPPIAPVAQPEPPSVPAEKEPVDESTVESAPVAAAEPSAPTSPVTPESAPAAPAEEPVAAESSPPVEPPDTVVTDEERELAHFDRLHCVDVNTASRDDLLSLPAVTSSIADNILEYRETNGPLRSVFELRDIPRVGRVTFRKMTGMGSSQRRTHRITRLLRLLPLTVESANHLPTVTEELARHSGFTGAVISDADGLLLAQSGAEDLCDTLSAIIPRMFTQLAENIAELRLQEDVSSLSVSVGKQMFTIVTAGTLYVSGLHERRKLTKSQLVLVERVAAEMSWLLSKRAFVDQPAMSDQLDNASRHALS